MVHDDSKKDTFVSNKRTRRIVKHLKGTPGLRLFRLHPELRKQLWKGQLWNNSYFVETIGSTSEENIKRYIAHQQKVQM